MKRIRWLCIILCVSWAFQLTARSIDSTDLLINQYTLKQREAQIDCRKFETVYPTGIKSIPDDLEALDTMIYNRTKHYNVDVDIVKAIAAVSFNKYGSTLAATTEELGKFLDKINPKLESYLQRYNGDYYMALEALYLGPENIDLLYLWYGKDWKNHLSELDYINGKSMSTDTWVTEPECYFLQVLQYYTVYKGENYE